MRILPRLNAVILSIYAVLGFAVPTAAQPAWEWAVRGFSSGSFDVVYGRGITTDSQGNVFVAGRFSGSATFGDTNSPIASSGDNDAFLAKYNHQGQLQWAMKFGGTGYDEANGVGVDDQGNVYVAGRYAGPANIGPFTLTNVAAGFTAKIDAITTNVLWAREDGLDWFGLAVDGNGNSHVVGQALPLQLAGSKLAGPIVLAKYNANGVRQWFTNTLAANLNTSGSGQAIALDAEGNLFITGIFRRIVEFGPISLTNAAAANNVYDEVFVAKFSSAGIPQWARRGGGEGNDQGLGIGVDGTGNVIVTGSCDNTTALNSGTSVQFDIGGFVFPGAVGGGLGNMFIAKFSSNGTGTWARKLPGMSLGAGIHVMPAGEFYASGNFRGASLDFGGVTLDKLWTNEELFAVKYDSAGNAVWGRRTSSTLAGTRFGRGITARADGSVYQTGEYLSVSPIIFDTTTLGSKSTGSSMFVAKLAAASPAGITVQGLTLLGGGVVQLSVSGASAPAYAIEGSGTPANFTAIATNPVTGGVIQFADPASIGAAARFYRLRQP
jgi:hypothetical protein